MTAQAADILCMDGRVLPLFSNPLEELWGGSISGLPRYVPSRPRFVSRSTANWRGYVGTWTIERGLFYLAAIDGDIEIDEGGDLVPGEAMTVDCTPHDTRTCPASLELLFPDSNGRVLAGWFTGELRVPEGRPIRYVYMGYGSVFEHEMSIRIDRGIVVETRVVHTGEEYRREQEALQKSLDRVLEARPDADGWLRCPHCGGKFTIRQKKRWDGERHRCGGRVRIEGPAPD